MSEPQYSSFGNGSGGGCPFGFGRANSATSSGVSMDGSFTNGCPSSSTGNQSPSASSVTCPAANANGHAEVTYSTYLKLNTLLACQQPHGRDSDGALIHDEHLFIVTHQVYELWFKQILFEIDSVRDIFSNPVIDESKLLLVTTRLHRVVLIMKLLTEQFAVLETMTPLDFMDFRSALKSSSGFQSHQFRLLENKLGVVEANRTKYSKMDYKEELKDPAERTKVERSTTEASLSLLVQKWLERTPGLEQDGYNFLAKYTYFAKRWLDDVFKVPAEQEADPVIQQQKFDEYLKQKDCFEYGFDQEKYKVLLERGEHRFSHQAFLGALMISVYRNEPRFHQPYQVLTLLMDIDALLIKWRFFHVSLVQRMIGIKMGTGGSSGYQYLRATVSDRYKAFLDLCNVSTYLIPRDYVPKLSREMEHRLSIMEKEPRNKQRNREREANRDKLTSGVEEDLQAALENIRLSEGTGDA